MALGMEKGGQLCDRSEVKVEEEVKVVVRTDWKWVESGLVFSEAVLDSCPPHPG